MLSCLFGFTTLRTFDTHLRLTTVISLRSPSSETFFMGSDEVREWLTNPLLGVKEVYTFLLRPGVVTRSLRGRNPRNTPNSSSGSSITRNGGMGTVEVGLHVWRRTEGITRRRGVKKTCFPRCQVLFKLLVIWVLKIPVSERSEFRDTKNLRCTMSSLVRW